MKKALIILYYWPPAGGPGVQRWLKFIKYLPQHGIQPVICIPENPDYPIIDNGLESDIPQNIEVLKVPIWEPYKLASIFSKKTKNHQKGFILEKKKQNWKSALALWVRGNFFIPDARRFWIKPCAKYLTNYLSNNRDINTIITSGPPHSLHLIGVELKNNFKHIQWISDFRDPWTGISYHQNLRLTNWAQKKHKKLELSILKNADKVLLTSHWDAKNSFSPIYKREYDVITNGYDFEPITPQPKKNAKPFKLVYAGNLEPIRNPKLLWEALEGASSDITLDFYGNVHEDIQKEIQERGIGSLIHFKGYIPHQELIQKYKEADALLLFTFYTEEQNGILPGKLFEYYALQKPIISFGHKDAYMGKWIQEKQIGIHIDSSKLKILKNILEDKKTLDRHYTLPNREHLEEYSRKNLTKKLVQLF